MLLWSFLTSTPRRSTLKTNGTQGCKLHDQLYQSDSLTNSPHVHSYELHVEISVVFSLELLVYRVYYILKCVCLDRSQAHICTFTYIHMHRFELEWFGLKQLRHVVRTHCTHCTLFHLRLIKSFYSLSLWVDVAMTIRTIISKNQVSRN